MGEPRGAAYTPPVSWVRTPGELARLAGSWGGARVLALDTESDSLHHHREKVCLMQVATGSGEAFLVDPLALRDLSPLAPILADPETVKVLHGADYDVVTLKRDFGFSFAGLFDTMIAARLLGMPEIGLVAVARAELGVELSKASQKDDWSRRPLTPAQEAYALADVRHLIPLYERLLGKLRGKGRLAWVLEECDAVAALEPARRGRGPDAFLGIKGARRLSRRGLAVLRELDAWREARAEAADLPAFRIAGAEALLAVAAAAPKTPADLARIRGLPPRLRAAAHEILDAVSRGLALPEDRLPRPPQAPPRPAPSPETRRRIEALKAWRAEEARRLEVDASVVLPQRLLERVAETAPGDAARLAEVPELRRWRIAAFGAAMLDVLRRA
jgi:ribonuclease D